MRAARKARIIHVIGNVGTPVRLFFRLKRAEKAAKILAIGKIIDYAGN
jgi:hypothetical protein